MKLIFLSTLLFLLVGCGKTLNQEQAEVMLTPPPINPIITREVIFKVESREGKAWYLISPQTYENLSYNVQEMLRYIREQKAVIEYYENIQ